MHLTQEEAGLRESEGLARGHTPSLTILLCCVLVPKMLFMIRYVVYVPPREENVKLLNLVSGKSDLNVRC